MRYPGCGRYWDRAMTLADSVVGQAWFGSHSRPIDRSAKKLLVSIRWGSYALYQKRRSVYQFGIWREDDANRDRDAASWWC
jgi:hypothetical protein